MDRLLRIPAPGARSRLALAVVKTFTLAGLLCVMVTQGPPSSTPQPGTDLSTQVADAGGAGCAGALVRTTRGELRKVSFAVGWDVYTGRRSGTLVTACLDGSDGPVNR